MREQATNDRVATDGTSNTSEVDQAPTIVEVGLDARTAVFVVSARDVRQRPQELLRRLRLLV